MATAPDDDGPVPPTVTFDLEHARVLLEYCLVVREILDACGRVRDDGIQARTADDSPVARSAASVVRSGVTAAAEIIIDIADERVDDLLVDEALDALMDAIDEATP